MSTTYEVYINWAKAPHEALIFEVEGDSVLRPAFLSTLSWADKVRPALETIHARIIPIPDHPYEITSRGETYRFRWVGNKLMSVYEIEPGGKWREMEYEEIPEHIKELL